MKRQGQLWPLVSRVLAFTREHELLAGQRRLLVAVSGGPDSVCLLHILSQLQVELGIKLHVAHLDHRLRGAESEADAGYVARLAERLGIPSTVGQRDVTAHKARRRLSLEEAAREVRYTFLAETASSIGADRVAVGHTIDDQVETILMHLIRGTGIRGLRGLRPSSLWQADTGKLTVIRPLLAVSRQETVAYCHDRQLEPRTDTSNQSLFPLRNRIRHQLVPLLQSYNPMVAEALLRTARIAAADLAFLDEECARFWDSIVQRQGDIITLDKAGLFGLPAALQRHLLRMAIEQLSGKLKDIESRHVDQVMAALSQPAGKKLNLPGGLVFTTLYQRYSLASDSAAPSPFPVLKNELALEIPGETLLPGWRVTAAILDREQIAEEEIRDIVSRDAFTAFLDLEKAGDKATVRSRRAGDRFQPLGMSQPKKLGEFMVDAKIPRAWRQRVPVVCSPEQVLWVAGWRIDERVKVTGDTRHVLRLQLELVPGASA